VTEPWVETRSPQRDRLTWISYSQLALFAWLMYALGATNALLRDDQGTSRTMAGLHSTSLAVSGIIAGLLASRLIAGLGRGVVLRLASIGLIAGVVAYSWPGAPYALSMTGAFLSGLFGTLIVITVNAFLLDHQGTAGPSTLTEANAMAAASSLLGPVAVGIGAATAFGWQAGLLVAAAGLVIVEIWRGRDVTGFGEAGHAAHAAHRRAPLPRRIYWSLAVIMCFLGTEMTAVYWSADLLRERAGFGAAAAAAAISAIAVGMAAGRFVGSRLARSVPSERLLIASVVVALVGFFLSWLPTMGAIIVLGMLVTGLGLGVQWPLGVARTVRASGGMTDRASALSSVAGSSAIATAPFALGVLSDTIGFHTAFLLLPVLLGIALTILVIRPVPDVAAG
jgi:predicted MFS family arabinose efflux permease